MTLSSSGRPHRVSNWRSLRRTGAHGFEARFPRIDSHEARIILLEAAPRSCRICQRPQQSAPPTEQLGGPGPDLDSSAGAPRRKWNWRAAKHSRRKHLWAAGVSATALTAKLGVELDRAGRVKVNPDLSLSGHPQVFAIGDLALVLQENGKPVPGVSPAAMQNGPPCRSNHPRRIGFRRRTSSTPPFEYWDRGTMATIAAPPPWPGLAESKFPG